MDFQGDKSIFRQSNLSAPLMAVCFGGALIFMLLGQFLIGPPNIHSARALVMVVEVVLIVFWLLSNPEAFPIKESRFVKWGVVVWLFVGFIGIPFATYNWAAAFIGKMEWLAHFLTLVAFADFFRRDRIKLDDILSGLVIAGLTILAFYSYRWTQIQDPHAYNWVWGAKPFLNIRHFAFLMLPAYLAAVFFLVERRGVWRLAFILMASLLLAALLWAGGRASIGAAAVGTVLLFFLGWRRDRISGVSGLLLVGGLVVSALLISQTFAVNDPRMGLSFNHGRIDAESTDQLASGRLSIWLSVFSDMSVPEWLIGHGVDNYRFLPGRSDATVHPHSLFFQAVSAWGMPLAIVLAIGCLWLVGSLLVRAIHPGKEGRGRYPSAAVGAASAILVSYLLLSAVDGNFYHSWGVFIALPFLAFGLVVLLDGKKDYLAGRNSKLSGAWLYASGALLVLVFVQLINVTTVFGNKTPQPNDWRVALVMAIPYNTLMVEGWLGEWERQDPQQMLKLLRWLQNNSALGFRYMLMESEMLAQAGYSEASLRKYEQALSTAPKEAQVKIREVGPPTK